MSVYCSFPYVKKGRPDDSSLPARVQTICLVSCANADKDAVPRIAAEAQIGLELIVVIAGFKSPVLVEAKIQIRAKHINIILFVVGGALIESTHSVLSYEVAGQARSNLVIYHRIDRGGFLVHGHARNRWAHHVGR